MNEGVVDFMEPDTQGKYRKEAFTITTEDTEDLEATLEQVAEEIRTLAFWERTCGDPKCPYCQLRGMVE